MKVGLALHRAGHDREANMRRMVDLAEECAAPATDLVLFSEAAPTGLRVTDDSAHDLALGEAIPGPAIATLRAAARRLHIWIGFGLLERAGGRLFDSAALIDRHGRLRLHYRRIDPHWHGSRADPAVYGEGYETPVLEDEFGRVGFLIGGDVFNDGAVGRMWAQRPDVVLVPSARGLDAGMHGDEVRSGVEQPEYAERFKAMSTSGLVVNSLTADDEPRDCIGGAIAIDSQGRIVAELPSGVEAALVVELD